MRDILSITKALADQNRIRIIAALSHCGELCVCQLQELLCLAPSSTSKHLSILANAGLVTLRKDGRWAYYRLAASRDIPASGSTVLQWLRRQAPQEKLIADDHQKLQHILRYSPEELCLRQANGQKCCSSAPATPAVAKSPRASRGRSSPK